MVKVKEDLVGKIFGRLTVVKQVDDYIDKKGNHYARWLCGCSCSENKQILVRGSHLTSNKTTSCGCIRKEKLQEVGYIQGRLNKKYNHYEIRSDEYGDYYVGWTSNTNREFYFDIEDYDKVKGYCWLEHIVVNRTSTLISTDNKNNKTIYMHILLGYRGYDHIDRNELNNRTINLRKATVQENAMNRSLSIRNTSGVTGVAWSKAHQKWHAYLQYNKELKLDEFFVNKIDAIKARLWAEYRYFKEFAPQQHLYEKYGIGNQEDITNVNKM